MKKYTQFYAEGQFLSCESSHEVPVINPSTEAPIASVQLCSEANLDRAVRSAHAAFASWSQSTLDERRQLLQRLVKEIEARKADFSESLAREMGCPVWLGNLMQVNMPLNNLQHTIDGIDQVVWQETVGNGLVERRPVGVIAAITPWNFPLHQIVAKVAGALAAGCTLVIKPSEVAPGAAELFMQAVHAAEIPPGLINLVWGDASIGNSLVTHPLIDAVSFTGSTVVGRKIMAAAAATPKRAMLELGGKSAAVILDEDSFDAALPVVARMVLANSGQACVSQSRLVLPKHLLGQATERMQALFSDWPLGDPLQEATRLGPVATKTQFNHVNHLLEQAVAQGARLHGGKPGRADGFDQGWFCSPTVVTQTEPHMDIIQTEVFGPVLAIQTYQNEDEALALANCTPYGLSGAIWSDDHAKAQAFARKMRTGQIVINGAVQNLATPFGGFGYSGFGRENGRFGIEGFLEYQSIQG